MASTTTVSFQASPEGRAILTSLAVGLLIVAIKTGAYYFSGSKAIMADMLESFVHNLAVIFAAYCLWFSQRPADINHLYGHGKVEYLSSAVEGAFVCAAGILILVNSFQSLLEGYQLRDVGMGMAFSCLAAAINGVLAWHLIRTGRREKSILIEANGRHILSDVVTTGGALAGVVAAIMTGYVILDLIVAFLSGAYILYEGLRMLRQSMGGLLDEASEEVDRTLRRILEEETTEHHWSYHALRHRTEGKRIWVELHLVFNKDITLETAHEEASHLETQIRRSFAEPVYITTHLEPKSFSEPAVDE